MLHTNIAINEKGHLTFAGYDTVDLAEEYGTPLYLLDEQRVRDNCRLYRDSLRKAFGGGSAALYASKALAFKDIYRIVGEEGLCADVVSAGEIYTALKAGFAPEKMYFHGSSKSDDEIRFAMDSRVGCFIADNREETEAISREAGRRGICQDIILRLTPGIDPHTFEAVNTGKLDCQFGTPIETGQAIGLVGDVLRMPNIRLTGFHCHIGSQIFDWIPFRDASDIMLEFMAEVKRVYGYEAAVLDLGGGFGVRYVETDPEIDIPASIERTAEYVKARCAGLGLSVPDILMEPGRSIVADAGMTLYTVENVKTIEGYRSYISVDGGMTDNPRYALYGSEYTLSLANRASEPCDFLCTVAGRCCESGALIQENLRIPRPVRGDVLAVFVTGAYNYSMASNYNRVCRPALVILSREGVRIGIRRETFEDLTACDV